ncbi:SdpI family protein [uncultured Dokdonia sp.]|uniref:SdpI family protein n=1 Tax=uncultured Dokdonia sp. TaxID=575653 RepID=UPI00262D7897|nr:SdpI family protein [uncultured Dokdonia sp.]
MSVENSALLFQGILFLVLGFYYLKRPPKKINHWYGYRTRRSMANQEIWDFANRQSAKDFWHVAIAVMLTGLVLLVFDIPFKVLIQVAVLLIGLAISVWHTEKEISKRFDKNGNKKSKT